MKKEAKTGSPPSLAAIYALFFLSGASGLAYEIVWARQLSLTLGVSVHAVSATLAAFMGGLGLGAEISGRLLDRGASPIRLYSACEGLLGIYVLLFPLVWSGVDWAYLLLHGGAEGSTAYVTALRFALAVLALAPATTLMGATLPAVIRFAARTHGAGGGIAGTVYAVNTAGAMAGTMAAGFAMMEIFGLTDTLRIGAGANLACAAGAWLMYAEKGWRDGETAPSRKNGASGETRRDGLIIFLYGAVGFFGMALELLWTRALILLLNNTTYAFSLVLSMFLLGAAAGSAAAARARPESREKAALYFSAILIWVGVMALLSLAALSYSGWALSALAGFSEFKALSSAVPGGGSLIPALIFGLFVVAPCTALLGALFPLAAMAVSPGGERVGGDVGRLYAANIVGCVAGSIAAGYYMIPWMGVQNSLIGLALAANLAGTASAMRSSDKFRVLAMAPGVILVPLLYLLANRPDAAYQLSVAKLDAGAKVEFYEEGPSAAVLVSRNDSDLTAGRKPIRRLWINGDPIAGSFREALQLERLQAHIPLLMMKDPKTALVICFGTGSTAGAALAHGLESVTAVDISREVFHAGPGFSDGNLGAASSPRLKMVEEDGRNYLKTTGKFYDLITAEPPPPSNAGVASLYTVEYYELVRSRLAPGGLASQWIPIHHLSGGDLRRLAAAFFRVFPQGAMWYTKWDAIMIGGKGPLPGYQGIYGAFGAPAVAESLRGIGVYRPEQILANHMMGPAELARYVAGAEPMTDDRPVVEFSSPRIPAEEGVRMKGSNLLELLRFRSPPPLDPDSGRDREAMARAFDSQTEYFLGQADRSADRNASAAARFEKAVQIDPENSDAIYALLSLNIQTLYSAMSAQEIAPVFSLLRRTEKLDAGGQFAVQLKFLRGVLLARSGELGEAEAELTEAVRMDPGYFLALVTLAGLSAQNPGGEARALGLYNRALALDPTPEEAAALRETINSITKGGNGS